MEVEDRLALRLAYVKSLEPLLEAMGPSVIQLSKKLLTVLEEYLDRQTPDARHYAILVTKKKKRMGTTLFYSS